MSTAESMHALRDRRLGSQDGPLVWIDCEMTGLDPKRDKLLEIAVIITDGELDAVDDGIEFVIKRDKSVMDNMGEWCVQQHGKIVDTTKSGLTQACLESLHDKDEVSRAVLEYIQRWIPEKRTGMLAGNSVHADRSFLVEEMPDVVNWLHYRIVGEWFVVGSTSRDLAGKPDVSSIKELCRRWYPGSEVPPMILSDRHRAMEDIKSSIRELAWYRANIFRAP